MFRPLDTFRATLLSRLKPEDTALRVAASSARYLDRMDVGDHTYFVLGNHEIVRYTHEEPYDEREDPLLLEVVRDVTAVGRVSLPAGSCLRYQWVAPAFTDYFAQLDAA